MYTYDENIFSNAYKEAYGSRPRDHRFYESDCAPAEKQEIWDSVMHGIEDAAVAEKEYRMGTAREFEALVDNAINAGAKDRSTAIRWIIDAQDFSDIDFRYGGGFICYHFGLAYSDYEDELAAVVAEHFKVES